jgi:hypothetical protein
MVNADLVNAGRACFRRRIFANLFAFLAEFYDSRIRLNIFATAKLTLKRCIPRRSRPASSATFWRMVNAKGVGGAK